MSADYNLRQPPLFSTTEVLELPNSDIVIYRGVIDSAQVENHLYGLVDEVEWRQEQIQMFNKSIDVPRLTAWYGDDDKPYTYSGIEMHPSPWTDRLLTIKAQVESLTGARFNSALLNHYRNGSDGVAWHADDEPELGPAPVIASVSLGDTRDFQFRSNDPSIAESKTTVELCHGDLLVMSGATQEFWKHQVPKRANASIRVNITFRQIFI